LLRASAASRLSAAHAYARDCIPTLFVLGLGSSGENQHASGKTASREHHLYCLSLDLQ
jgi:hypothetical protein